MNSPYGTEAKYFVSYCPFTANVFLTHIAHMRSVRHERNAYAFIDSFAMRMP